MILAIVVAPLAQAGEEASAQWRPRGIAATRNGATAARFDAAAKPRVERAVLQWTSSQSIPKRPRNTILRVNAYEDAVPALETPESSDDALSAADDQQTGDAPDADSDAVPSHQDDSFRETSQAAGDNDPLSTPSPAADAKDPPAAARELPTPETTKKADEPTPMTPADDLFKDDPIPTPPDRQLPLPSGDLSEGIDTVPPGGPGCQGYEKECRRALQELQRRDITTVIVGVVIEGTEGEDFPCDCKMGRDFDAPKFAGRNFSPTLFTWKASGTCHKPLYFEDVQLERYGHSWNPIVQPFVSGAHFFVSVPLLPYKMGLRTPNECVYTLGYYRPGNCAPYMFEPIPLSLRGAVFEAFGATAFAFWFWPPN